MDIHEIKKRKEENMEFISQHCIVSQEFSFSVGVLLREISFSSGILSFDYLFPAHVFPSFDPSQLDVFLKKLFLEQSRI